MEHKAKNGELRIVATPIGNLGDITLRALDALKTADAIYCEDTRHSRKLLERHGIGTPLYSYHEHNAARQRPVILEKLAQGQQIALISDAGTPLISDPGYKLVHEARAQGATVTPLPGACAAITALCASGLPTDRFYFVGFLPPKSTARRKALQALRSLPATLVFYESPQRVAAMLADAAEMLGSNRPATLARELTKQFETFHNASLGELSAHYAATETPKGEIVVLIEGAEETVEEMDDDALLALLREALTRLPVKDAAAEVSAHSGRPKRECYQLALTLKA